MEGEIPRDAFRQVIIVKKSFSRENNDRTDSPPHRKVWAEAGDGKGG